MSLGCFNAEVLQRLNVFFKQYALCPSCGDYDDTYYVGLIEENGDVEDWVQVDGVEREPWGKDFLAEWNVLQEENLFVGEVFYLEHEKSFFVGENCETIETTDKVVRCFRKDSKINVLTVLNGAAFVLFDPENDATEHQGAILSVEEVADAKVPTLRFTLRD